MPPRRRSRKTRPGSSRSDAAMEHMKLIGFEEDVVKTTIKELLEAYGEEGWVFIEEGSYQVLVEAILEKGPRKKHLTPPNGDSPQGDNLSLGGKDSDALAASSLSVVAACNAMKFQVSGEDETHPLDVKPSSAAPACSSTEDALTRDQDLDPACQSDLSPQPINELEAKYPLPPPEGESSVREDMDLDQDIEEENQPDIAKGNDDDDDGGPSSTCLSPSKAALPSEQADTLPTPRPRRRPYYGWIDSDEEVDLVELEPAPVPEVFSKLIRVADAVNKRSRRDTGPDNL